MRVVVRGKERQLCVVSEERRVKEERVREGCECDRGAMRE